MKGTITLQNGISSPFYKRGQPTKHKFDRSKKTNLQGTSLLIANELIELSNTDRYQKLTGAKRFITTFTTSCHLSVSSARSIIPNPPSSFLKSILILSSFPHLGLPNGLFPPSFSTKHYMYSSSLSYILHTLYISMSLV